MNSHMLLASVGLLQTKYTRQSQSIEVDLKRAHILVEVRIDFDQVGGPFFFLYIFFFLFCTKAVQKMSLKISKAWQSYDAQNYWSVLCYSNSSRDQFSNNSEVLVHQLKLSIGVQFQLIFTQCSYSSVLQLNRECCLLSHVVLLLVYPQVLFPGKSFPAVLAGEWPLSGVDALMRLQVAWLREPFPALGTAVRPLARVNADVCLQASGGSKAFSAVVADEAPIPAVPVEVERVESRTAEG